MVKIDLMGQTLSVNRTKVKPKDTIGAPGFAVFGGHLDNQEKSSSLVSPNRYSTFQNNLVNTAIIGAGVRYFLNLVAKAEWQASPRKGMEDSAEAAQAAEFALDVLDSCDISWHRIVRKTALYRFHGFNIQEWTAARRERDGMIGFSRIEPRPQHTITKWDTDPHGRVLGVVQQRPGDHAELYLPREKIVYAVDDAVTDNPEGVGIFRHIVEVTTRLRAYEKLEGIGYESDLSGVPYARVPLEELNQKLRDKKITQSEYDAAILPIRTFIENHIRQRNTGLALDSSTYRGTGEQQTPANSPKWDMQLLSAAVTSSSDIHKAIERCNREIARVLGVEQMLLGDGDGGSFALSRDKTNSLFLQVGSTLKELAETYERDLLDPLWAMNGLDPMLRPQLSVEEIAVPDFGELAESLRSISAATGPMELDDEPIKEWFQMVGLTPPRRGFEEAALPLNTDDEEEL